MVDSMGIRINERRQELGWSLAELGTRVGVGASTVRKWETGFIKDMRSDKIQKVADALGVTPAYLMGWDEKQNVRVDRVKTNNGVIGQTNAPVTINGKGALSKEESRLLRIYGELEVSQRMKLMMYALDLEEENKRQ